MAIANLVCRRPLLLSLFTEHQTGTINVSEIRHTGSCGERSGGQSLSRCTIRLSPPWSRDANDMASRESTSSTEYQPQGPHFGPVIVSERGCSQLFQQSSQRDDNVRNRVELEQALFEILLFPHKPPRARDTWITPWPGRSFHG